MQNFIVILRAKLNSMLESKTSFGRIELKSLLEAALTDALVEYYDILQRGTYNRE